MSEKTLHRLIAGGVCIIAVFVYLRTLSATVVFWDVGEFCAAARLLQVPHPPGSPLFVLGARLASLIPFRDDIAARMHTVSAFSSALAVMFLFLVSVEMIIRLRGEIRTTADRLIVYGSSAVGALTLAFSSTFWSNAIEAEVYGPAIFFISLILWIVLRWWRDADDPRSGRWILMIAYMLGLSLGVHILALLAAIPVVMIIGIRRPDATGKTLVMTAVAAVLLFLVIYPGIIRFLPSLLGGGAGGIRSDLLPLLPPLLIVVLVAGAVREIRRGRQFAAVIYCSILFIGLGYTSYIQVIVRSNVDNLPMKQNSPDNLTRFTGYIGREQYGETPLFKGPSWDNERQQFVDKYFPRRWSREPMHTPTRMSYTSDWDFLWRYQINHMFVRYLMQNFIGSEGGWQDAGVAWGRTWGIPFFLALAGMYYQLRKDWKMGIPLMIMFIIMGVILALYQNQQDPQPRERDYFYVGAYYCMAIWISIAVALILAGILRVKRFASLPAVSVSTGLFLMFAVLPANLLRANWKEHDRSGIFIAWDYSYNLLQSCEPNAILFTNGDNDTFPLWYLQDVEGIRTDVRVVCLSYANAPWYVRQLKHETPHEAERVPISLSDGQIDHLMPVEWQSTRVDIPVPLDAVERFKYFDPPPPSDSGAISAKTVSFQMDGVPYQDDKRMLRRQDIVVRDIILSNRWQRPVYFSATCSPDSKIGLDEYLWLQGLVYKLKPWRCASKDVAIDYPVLRRNMLVPSQDPSRFFQRGYLYRNLDNPSVQYDEDVCKMVMNYRSGFLRLSEYTLHTRKDSVLAKEILAVMDHRLPVSVLPIPDLRIEAYIMRLLQAVGDAQRLDRYANDIVVRAQDILSHPPKEEIDLIGPYEALVEVYDVRKDYSSAISVLNTVSARFPRLPGVDDQIRYYRSRLSNHSAAGMQK